ncbi:hypothetical protein PUN28_017804 [Cardiocondyla obscurior]|uniref:Secreted protein n=1 Tax=Cardiocondyla obscurior TaxID=286306 RepID=A0AAW2EQ05_9HYME
MSPVSLFFVTTSLCREWVICAPAAFLGCGSRLTRELRVCDRGYSRWSNAKDNATLLRTLCEEEP